MKGKGTHTTHAHTTQGKTYLDAVSHKGEEEKNPKIDMTYNMSADITSLDGYQSYIRSFAMVPWESTSKYYNLWGKIQL